MTALLVLPVVLSALLMAAHVLRAGMLLLAAAFILLPFLLLVRRAWVPPVVQLVLLGAAAEWIRTLVTLAHGRMAAGAPWIRMAVILGVVVVVTLGAAAALRHPRLRGRYEQ